MDAAGFLHLRDLLGNSNFSRDRLCCVAIESINLGVKIPLNLFDVDPKTCFDVILVGDLCV